MSDNIRMYTSPRIERDRRPLAVQVRDSLIELIREQGLRPGDRVPTEEELGEHFQVGRTTVREALRRLEEQGLIEVQRGLGRFIAGAAAHRVHRPITRFESTTEMMRSLGYQPSSRLLSVSEDTASATEATALDIAVGDPVIRLVRLRMADGDPVLYCINVLRREGAPGPLESHNWTGSVIDLLESHAHNVTSSAARINSGLLPEEAAGYFPDHAHDPWLLISEICVTDSGMPILLAFDYYRGDIFTFEVVRRRD